MWRGTGYPKRDWISKRYGSDFARGFKTSSLYGIARLAFMKKGDLVSVLPLTDSNWDESQVLDKYVKALKDEIFEKKLWNAALGLTYQLLCDRGVKCDKIAEVFLDNQPQVAEAIRVLKLWEAATTESERNKFDAGKKDLKSAHYISEVMRRFFEHDKDARAPFLQGESGAGVLCLTSGCGYLKRELEYDCRGFVMMNVEGSNYHSVRISFKSFVYITHISLGDSHWRNQKVFQGECGFWSGSAGNTLDGCRACP